MGESVGIEMARSILDIYRLNPNVPEDWDIITTEYKAENIHQVKIDGDIFTNYSAFQFIWEKTYAKQPKRSTGGVIGNLNAYSTFVTPHLLLNFSLMSIDDYRAIMIKDLSKNEFIVECYDPIYNRPTINKMYFAPAEMAKLHTIARHRFNDNNEWEDFIELVGIQNYTVELIGTNADIDYVSLIYHLNAPEGYTASEGVYETYAEDDVYIGEEVVIGSVAQDIVNETFGGKLRFRGWNISDENPLEAKTEGNFINGNTTTITNPYGLHLYAQWESATEFTLTYNYGIADPAIDDEQATYITSKKISKGDEIGILPTVNPPSVEYKPLGSEEKETAEPYENGNWYKTPIKTPNSVALTSKTIYWLNRDSTIYLLFDTKKYNLALYIDGKLYQSNVGENGIEYNTPMNLPALVKEGFEFDGWYYKSDYSGNKISGNMPPEDIKLYARWVKEK